MAKISSDTLAKLLKSGEIAKKREAVYLLYGVEPGRLTDAANALKDSLLAGLGGEENYFRYLKAGGGPDEATVGDVIAQLNTVSMFGDGKLVWLGHIETVDKHTAPKLLEYAGDPNPQSTLLITVAISKESRGAMASFEKSGFLKEITQLAPVIRFATKKLADLKKWFMTRMRSLGLSIDPEAANLFIELCDNDIDRLGTEIGKLVSYVGDRKEVTLEDIEISVGNYRIEKIWGLTKAFGRLDLGESLAALSNLLDSNTPAQVILKALVTEIMRISAAVDQRLRGQPFNSFASELGGHPFPLEIVWANSKKWTPDLARDGLQRVLKANMDIMRGNVSPETSLGAMLVDILKPADRVKKVV